jgi:hypothetical protein
MVTLFQEFEFVYSNGDLFYDRSGALARRLQDVFPGLTWKETLLNQRQFSIPSQHLQLLFGVAVSRLQSFNAEELAFGDKAAALLVSVSEFLEIDTLSSFSFKHVIGKPLANSEQAQELMWPVVGEDQRARLASVSPLPTWTSLQGQFTQGPFSFETRLAVMDLTPPPHLNVGGPLLQKMQKMILQRVQFANASLEEAVEYLIVKSRDLDKDEHNPSERGVMIELQASNEAATNLTLELENVPMLEALRYIVELAGLRFKLAPDRVLVVDSSDNDTLPHVTFHLHVTGQQTITIAEFDVAAFIKNFREKHSEDILSKLAPHLSIK